jgi:histidinol-phosphate aminotransferase
VSPAAPRPGLRKVEPYESPQPDVKVRLNTNECPYPMPAAFGDDLAEAVRDLTLNRYPDREATELRERLAKRASHPIEGTWVANGSNEVIHQLLLAYGGPGRAVVTFEPTYVLHDRLSWVAHSDVVGIRLDEPWTIGEDRIAEALAARPAVVFVCSPNNPTGNAQPLEAVVALASPGNALVIVDEAYVEFGGTTAAGLLGGFSNVVVVRTFSKAFALAGARVGYCLAAPEVVDDLRRVRLPYHLSAITQAAALVALRHADDAEEILREIRAQRERIVDALRDLGATPFPSDANFVLFRPSRPAKDVWQALLDRDVLVRDMTAVVPETLRVTAGTPEEVDLFLSALEGILS